MRNISQTYRFELLEAARLNKLVTELWYSHKHTMQVLN